MIDSVVRVEDGGLHSNADVEAFRASVTEVDLFVLPSLRERQ